MSADTDGGSFDSDLAPTEFSRRLLEDERLTRSRSSATPASGGDRYSEANQTLIER